jgi:hypothetical protein
MTGQDLIIHYGADRSADNKYYQPFSLKFYLARQVSGARGDLWPDQQFIAQTPEQIDSLIEKFSDRNVWLIQYRTRPVKYLTKKQSSLFDLVDTGNTDVLDVLGAPTENFVIDGDMENQTTFTVVTDGSAKIISVSEHGSVHHYLKFVFRQGEIESWAEFKLRSLSKQKAIGQPAKPFRLDPQKIYTFSCQVNASDLLPGKEMDVLQILVLGQDRFGAERHVMLHGIAQNDLKSGEWTFFSCSLSALRNPAIFGLSDISLRVVARGNVESVSIDKLQLESGSTPTPFTTGVRLPHDQALLATED